MNGVLTGSVLSALSTGLGAVPILFMAKSLTHRWRDVLLAFSAGIMMAASMTSLIPETLRSGGFEALAIGLAAGVLVLTLLEMTVPHIDLEHTKSGLQFDEKAMLIIAAIAMHNLPRRAVSRGELRLRRRFANRQFDRIGHRLAKRAGRIFGRLVFSQSADWPL